MRCVAAEARWPEMTELEHDAASRNTGMREGRFSDSRGRGAYIYGQIESNILMTDYCKSESDLGVVIHENIRYIGDNF